MDELDGLTLDFAARHPDSFARTLAQGATEDIERILESMPAALKASIVARLPAALIRMLLEVERHQPGNWLIDAPFDDAVMLLSRIPREKRLALVNSLHERDRRLQLLRLQQYPAHSIGALVADIALRISVDTPAAAVLAELRELDIAEQGPVVIVDAAGHYLGTLDRWRLLMRNPQSGTVKDYLLAARAVLPETPVSALAASDEWHTHGWLPVVDHQHRVLGAVSRENVLRAASTQSGRVASGGDILLDLLADLVYLCETALRSTFAGKGPT